MLELILFADARSARAAGFRSPTAAPHPQSEDIWAWWPSLGNSGILSPAWQRITLTPGFAGYLRSKVPRNGLDADAREAVQFLRGKIQAWGAQAIWLDLS